MNGNPFYIAPGNNQSGALAGLGAIAGEYRQRQRAEEIKSALQNAYSSGDANAIAELTIKYPEAKETIQSLYGFRNEQTKRNALDTYKAVLSNKDNPQEALNAIDRRIEFVKSQGGDPSSVTIRARDNLQSIINSGQDASPFFKAAEMEYAGIASPQEWNAYASAAGTDTGRIGQYNPGDYTPESWAKFVSSRDPSVLRRYENQQIVDMGGVKYLVDRSTGQRTPLSTVDEVSESEATIKGAGKRAEESAKNIEKYKETLFDSINSNGRLINKYKFAIKQIDNGAETGPVINRLPNLKEQSILVDVVRKEIGMEVLGSGLLGVNPTDRDVEFALTTSIPDNLRPDALKRELERRSQILEELNMAQEEYYRLIDEEGYTKGDILKMARERRNAQSQGGSGQGAMTPGINQQSTGGWSIRPIGQ